MSHDKVKIVKEFLSTEARKSFINFIDDALVNRPDVITYGPKDVNKIGPVIQVGDDQDFPLSYKLFSDILTEEQTATNLELSDQIINLINKEFNESNKLFLSSFWYRKQFPGSKISPHKDYREGINWHYEYSAIIYLNDFIGGELHFNDLGYSVKPEAGDLIIFNTKDIGIHEVKELNDIRYSMPMWFTYDENFALKG